MQGAGRGSWVPVSLKVGRYHFSASLSGFAKQKTHIGLCLQDSVTVRFFAWQTAQAIAAA